MNFRPSQIVILAAGVVLLVFSFFSFLTLEGAGDLADQCAATNRDELPAEMRADYDRACGAADGIKAWNTDYFFPLTTWPTILGVAVAGLTAAAMFANVKVPEVLGLSANQLLFGLSIPGALIMLGWLIQGTEEGTGWGIGFWFLLLGAIALVVGTAMELLAGDDAPSAPRAGSAPPTPF